MKQKTFTKEFKEQVVNLAMTDRKTGIALSSTAKRLGVSVSSICKWVKEFELTGTSSFPGKGHLAPYEDEIHKLKKALSRAEQERDILKKAMAYFVQNP